MILRATILAQFHIGAQALNSHDPAPARGCF